MFYDKDLVVTFSLDECIKFYTKTIEVVIHADTLFISIEIGGIFVGVFIRADI